MTQIGNGEYMCDQCQGSLTQETIVLTEWICDKEINKHFCCKDCYVNYEMEVAQDVL